MEKYSEVIGLPVISADSGKKVGVIGNIIFCPGAREIKAFLLERSGYEVRKKVALLEDVLNLGRDALIIKSFDCLKNLNELENTEEFKSKGEILGLKVYTKLGDDLGVVKDVLFDYRNGVIEGVEVSDGLFQDLVKGRNIVPLFGKIEFGEENILVDREAFEEIMTTGGGLKKKFLGE